MSEQKVLVMNNSFISAKSKLSEIRRIIVEINNSHLADTKIKEALNFLENLYTENAYLRQENQNLKNEINKLKGEQGTPNVKKSILVTKGFSSENERIEAERSNSPEQSDYGFKLDKKTLSKLQENDIPKNILELLEKNTKKTYSTEKEFISAIEIIIGEKNVKIYKSKLINHAFYRKRKRESKISQIKIDRTEICLVDKTILPEDVYFVGYNNKTVQDIIIKSDNVLFKKEVYYSPLQKKTFSGKEPVEYEREFGPGINTQIICMKYVSNMSQPKILETLKSYGVIISSTYISRYLTEEKSIGVFHKEKDNLFRVGLESGDYHQIDDTGSRENGQNKNVQIICNPYFTAYFTTDKKDRLTIIDLFRFLKPRMYMFNNETYALLEKMNVYHTTIAKIKELTADKTTCNDEQMSEVLDNLYPNSPKGKTTRNRIKEASAIAYYHQETGLPIIETLICDDAPQFKLITKNLGLCWIHDNRHYKKLLPIVESHKKELNNFQDKYWNYYGKLHEFKKNPTPEFAESLYLEFDELFSVKTGYNQLDERISKTKTKLSELLLVLKYPNIPLHNNASENSARNEKRYQDVSLQTKSKAGTKAKDSVMSIVDTCKKLGVIPIDFIHDRICKTFKNPSLANLIKTKYKASMKT